MLLCSSLSKGFKEQYPLYDGKVQDFGFEVTKFELQSHHYFQFHTNILGKDMNVFIPLANG